MPNTLLLDTVKWDLVVDAAGNIAMASEPYSLAQDAASACRTFTGECWYDTTVGIPYFSQILGQPINVQLLKQLYTNIAKTVPNVVGARAFISGLQNRSVSGQVQVTPNGALFVGVNF
jgi:hypothetical protein